MRRAKAFFTAAMMTSGLLLAACGNEESAASLGMEETKANTSSQPAQVLAIQSKENALAVALDAEDAMTEYDRQTAVKITFSGDRIDAAGSGVSVNGTEVLVSQAGTYYVTGNLQEGQLHVNSTGKGTVRLIFGGMSISNSRTAPVYIEEADKVIVTLEDGSANALTDKARATAELEDLSAALYSKADTVINGGGTLTVSAGFNDGITSKDDLKITGGSFQVTAADDGIIGKDLLQITGGTFVISARGDGLKSTYDTDTSKGSILITAGTFTIDAKNDGIQSENMLQIDGGNFQMTTGGGSAGVVKVSNDMDMGGRKGMSNPWQAPTQAATEGTDSAKGVKSVNLLSIYGGDFNIDSADDAVHSNGDVCIGGGNLTLASGDDGIHADGKLTVDGGQIDVISSYEGLEGSVITINGGNHKIKASDDGINAAGGDSTDSYATGRPGTSQGYAELQLVINGGTLYVNANGDGLDSNGTITLAGGCVYVDGPVSNNNGAIDYEMGMTATGGLLIAAGSSGMAQGPTSAQGVASVSITFAQSQPGGSTFALKESGGKTVAEYSPSKNYNHVVVISPDISSQSAYTACINGNETISFTTAGDINNVSSSGSVTQGGGAQGARPGGMQPNGGMKGDRGDVIQKPGNNL